MKLHLDESTATYIIRAYADGQITINDEVITESVIVTPTRLHRNWPPRMIGDLTRAHMADIEALQPEVVLLGTGSRLQFPDIALTAGLISQGIGVEVMDISAACRTYNVLVSEGRNVAAALLIR